MQVATRVSESAARPRAVATEKRKASLWFAASALTLFLGHSLLVNHFVPIAGVFSGRPLQGVDYDLHIGQVFRVVTALDRWGKSWLYDVQLLAGQPEGTITDSGSKGWELWTFAWTKLGVPRATAFNLFVLTMMLMGPVWIFFAGIVFRLGRWSSLLAAAMASTLWFFDSHLHWVWFVGMISWTGSSCIALFTLGLFYRFCARPRFTSAAITGVCLGTCLLIHPYNFFVLALPMGALYLRAWKNLPRKAHGWVVMIAAVTIAENAFWLENAFSHWQYILNSAFYAQARLLYLACDFFDVLCKGADSGAIGTRTGFRFLYLALAVICLVAWQRARDDRVLPIATSLITLYTVAYLGEFIPGMQQTQPYRHITPAMLLTCLPAAALVTQMAASGILQHAHVLVRGLLAALVFALAQQLLATQVLYFFPELVPTPPRHPDGVRSPLSGYGHVSHPDLPDHVRYTVPHDAAVLELGVEPCIQWLERHLPRGERVLVQAAALGERIAWRSGFEVLGGFFERNVMHVDANFFRGYQDRLATREQLAEYLQTFAVAWVVGERPEFQAVPELLERVAAPGGYPVYRTRIPVNRVLSGGGRVQASENRIQVEDSDPNQPLLLSYHWHEALRCSPNCRVQRQPMPIDRVGFIRIPAPHPPSLVIANTYER